MRKIGVVGNGTVGGALARCFMENYEVRVWDIDPNKSTHTLGDVLACGIGKYPDVGVVFVCIPETELDRFFSTEPDPKSQVWGIGRTANLVIKSTAPVGTTKRLRKQYNLSEVVHSPEFLTARCAVTDAQLPTRNIIGEPMDNGRSNCSRALYRIYAERFPGVPIFDLSSDESEFVKLMQNSFFAVKIAFFNEAYTIANHLKLSWKHVVAALMADGRIAHSHTSVPGPDGKFGFGGACLPKDLEAYIGELQKAGLRSDVSFGASERNISDRQRRG